VAETRLVERDAIYRFSIHDQIAFGSLIDISESRFMWEFVYVHVPDNPIGIQEFPSLRDVANLCLRQDAPVWHKRDRPKHFVIRNQDVLLRIQFTVFRLR